MRFIAGLLATRPGASPPTSPSCRSCCKSVFPRPGVSVRRQAPLGRSVRTEPTNRFYRTETASWANLRRAPVHDAAGRCRAFSLSTGGNGFQSRPRSVNPVCLSRFFRGGHLNSRSWPWAAQVSMAVGTNAKNNKAAKPSRFVCTIGHLYVTAAANQHPTEVAGRPPSGEAPQPTSIQCL